MNVGDKVFCIKSFLYNTGSIYPENRIVILKDHTYEITYIIYENYILKECFVSYGEDQYDYVSFHFNEKNIHLYFYEHFLEQKEYRKQKIQKINLSI